MKYFSRISMVVNLAFPLMGWTQATPEEFIILDPYTNPSQVIDEIKLPPPTLEGTYYIEDQWKKGNVFFKSKFILKDFLLKYDLEHHLLEIKTHDDIKVATANQLKSFEWKNDKAVDYTRFENCTNFSYKDGTPEIGFFEIMVEDSIRLLAKPAFEIVKSNYVPTLAMGRKNDKVVKKETFFIESDNIIYPVSSSKNKNYLLFKSKSKDIENFVKENNLSFKNGDDLIKIVKYYNTIFK